MKNEKSLFYGRVFFTGCRIIKGIASTIAAKLVLEILEKDIVPFYCCAWSNIKSARNTIRAGFKPAWVDTTVKPQELVEEMNK